MYVFPDGWKKEERKEEAGLGCVGGGTLLGLSVINGTKSYCAHVQVT
jgi:hypothetical protein